MLSGYNNYGEPEKKGVTGKVIGGFLLGIFGLFGSEFVNGFKGISGLVDSAAAGLKQESATKGNGNKIELKSTAADRGAMTRLTRREINTKLQNLPLFYITEAEAVFLDDAKFGTFFIEKTDAEKYLKELKGPSSLKITATTLDEVFYPLIAKKQKIGSFVKGVAGTSDITATYKLRASEAQISQSGPNFKSTHDGDVPLFRVTNLAFNRKEGLEIPLFVRKEDAMSAYNRLQEQKKEEGGVPLKAPDVQVTSVIDLAALFAAGGFEGRAIEIYPSIDALEAAQAMLAAPSSS